MTSFSARVGLPALFPQAVSFCLLIATPRVTCALQVSRARLPEASHERVRFEGGPLRFVLHHQPPSPATRRTGAAPVLFIHGASFPSALAVAFKLDGVSWMDDLATRGFDVWALDFLGYGDSDRYREMSGPAHRIPPLGRSEEAARQIYAAVEFIVRHTQSARVSLVAHSWGTIPAGMYAGDFPDRIERLVQFGPVTQRTGPPDTIPAPAYAFISEREQYDRFTGYVPAGESPVLASRHFAVWGPAYMATDPTSSTRTPPSVQVPFGPQADAADAWSGHLPYDPAKIRAPVLIVRGEWEAVTTDADARWLFDALVHAPLVRDVRISRGTHVVHLEESRYQLYAEVALFLAGGDRGPPPD